jgi:hypothetical protein
MSHNDDNDSSVGSIENNDDAAHDVDYTDPAE